MRTQIQLAYQPRVEQTADVRRSRNGISRPKVRIADGGSAQTIQPLANHDAKTCLREEGGTGQAIVPAPNNCDVEGFHTGRIRERDGVFMALRVAKYPCRYANAGNSAGEPH